MEVPLEISFRGVEKTEHLETLINEKAARMERVCPHMVSCRVAVEARQKHQQTDNPYRVRVAAHVPPEHEIVVRREETAGKLHEIICKHFQGFSQIYIISVKRRNYHQYPR
ncbi:MAG: HPF/RaiA family ribosome-associated protein [Desulfosudaceae bacterium]